MSYVMSYLGSFAGWLLAWIKWLTYWQWGMIATPFVASAIWLLNEVRNVFRLRSYLERQGYPPPHQGFSIRQRFINYKTLRFVGAAWLIRQGHNCLYLISLIIFAFAVARAVATGHSLEIARAGALVAIAGALSLLLGVWESQKSREIWNVISTLAPQDGQGQTIVERYRAGPIDEAQRYSTLVSVSISILGTLVWAYGDQVAACGLFKLLGIADQSSVACFP